MKLEKNFFLVDGVTLAKNLLGKVLVRKIDNKILKARIVETEAYMGPLDKAAHSYKNRRTNRTEPMFLEGGHIYIYLIYGIIASILVLIKKIFLKLFLLEQLSL